jgi:soluble lytic murein transglycosylase-like protein
MGPAHFLQTATRFLGAHPNLTKPTIRLLPGSIAGEIKQFAAVARKLRKLGGAKKKLKTGAPPPLSELFSHYDEAKRLGIDRHYLAAIHLVETKFGRVKSNSTAGAKGPMQFIPSTWKIYGRGGNIQDPHDAILAAARLLRANGAPGNYARALHAYNPSGLYVFAVSTFAKVIAQDPYAIYFLYCWGP